MKRHKHKWIFVEKNVDEWSGSIETVYACLCGKYKRIVIEGNEKWQVAAKMDIEEVEQKSSKCNK